MHYLPDELQELINVIKILPSIGNKNAERIVLELANNSKSREEVIKKLTTFHEKIRFCKHCNNIALNNYCDICLDTTRSKKICCVVPNFSSLYSMEKSGCFNGYYFVMNKEISPKNRVLEKDLPLNKLSNFVKHISPEKVIIATNFTIEGELTAEIIRKRLITNNKIQVYRIGVGIPLGSQIEYSDNFTLKQSLLNAKKY